MGRTSSSVISKWRELGGETCLEKRKNEWSIEEIAEFLKYIEHYSGVKFLKENNKNNCKRTLLLKNVTKKEIKKYKK